MKRYTLSISLLAAIINLITEVHYFLICNCIAGIFLGLTFIIMYKEQFNRMY